MQSANNIKDESIDALASILISSINNGTEPRVLNNLKRMDISIEKLFSLSNDKFEKVLLNKERNENRNSYWNIEKNYSSAFYSILHLYSSCIKTAIELNRVNIALKFKDSFGKLLRRYLLKKKDFNLLEMYFKEQEKLFVYCLDQNNGLSHSFGFHWYYDLTFDWSNTYGLFDLEFLEPFDKQIFKYIRYAIDKNNEKWLTEWIKWLHHGIGFVDSIKFSAHSYFDFNSSIDNLNELDYKFKNIYSLETYNDFVSTLEEKHKLWVKKDPINNDKKEKKLKETIKKAHTAYLFMNTKHLVFASFSYSLYKNSFKLLFKMLNTQSTTKSEVIMIGHTVFPQSLNDILDLWIKEDISYDDENWKFKFGEVFSENDYYERILTYIFITQLKLDKSSKPSNLEKFSISELMFLKDRSVKLHSQLDDFDDFEPKIKEINKDLDFASNKKNIKSILEKTTNEISLNITSKIHNTDISKELIKEFKDGFYEDYLKSSGFIKHILSEVNSQCFNRQPYNENINHFGIKVKLPRRYFVKETNTVVDDLGKQFSEHFIKLINTNFIKRILKKSENIYMDDIDSTIEKIGTDNIIILTTNYSDVLSNSNNFKNSWEINYENYNIDPDGFYIYKKENIPVFSFYTNTNDSKTFFLNRKKFFSWIDYTPSLKNENVKDDIYLSITEEVDDTENVLLDLYNTYELNFTDSFESFVIDG